MNFRRSWLHVGLILPVACVAVIPSIARAGTTYNYNANVASACTLSAGSVSVSVARGSGSTVTFNPSPTSVTASCNSASGGTLSVSSTRLQRPGDTVDYTLVVSGWGVSGNNTVSYATAAAAPPASTKTNASVGVATLAFSCSNGCEQNNIKNGNAYTAIITLGLSANP